VAETAAAAYTTWNTGVSGWQTAAEGNITTAKEAWVTWAELQADKVDWPEAWAKELDSAAGAGTNSDAAGWLPAATAAATTADTAWKGAAFAADPEDAQTAGSAAGLLAAEIADEIVKAAALLVLTEAVRVAQADVDSKTAEATGLGEEIAELVQVQALADAEVADVDAEILRLGPLTAAVVATAVQADLDTADQALATAATAAVEAGTALTGAVLAVGAAQVGLADSPLFVLAALRATAATALSDLAAARLEYAAAEALADEKEDDAEALRQASMAATVACRSAAFDDYSRTLAAAEATRAQALDAVEDFLAEQLAAKPAAKAQGARCEKALSNGTFRPARTDACDENLCCGAARVPQEGSLSETWLTIETCGPADGTQTTWSWTPPRAPLADAAPAGVSVAWTCIEGAQKLAAAASAAAAALYMLA
jgi:hypothetical protein